MAQATTHRSDQPEHKVSSRTRGAKPGSVERLLDEPPTAPGSRGTPAREDGDLQLPHERDQSVSADSTGGMGTGAAGQRQREVLEQARQDLDQGQVDTDMRATPGLDAQRRQGLVDDPKGAPAPRGSVAEHGKSGKSGRSGQR